MTGALSPELEIPKKITLNNLGQQILNRIVELKNAFMTSGDNKFIEPNIACYGPEHVFDDRLLTPIETVPRDFINS